MFKFLTVVFGTITLILVNTVATVLPWALLAGFIWWLFF